MEAQRGPGTGGVVIRYSRFESRPVSLLHAQFSRRAWRRVLLHVVREFKSGLYREGGVIEIRMRVGPKGQVVIPKVLRDALRIGPGSEVSFTVEGEKVVLRASRTDVVDAFERIAKAGKSIGKYAPHGAYEKELRRRRS